VYSQANDGAAVIDSQSIDLGGADASATQDAGSVDSGSADATATEDVGSGVDVTATATEDASGVEATATDLGNATVTDASGAQITDVNGAGNATDVAGAETVTVVRFISFFLLVKLSDVNDQFL